MFDGFQFSADNPYTYGEGKRLLKLAMAELRKDKSLKALGMDPVAPGRSAITCRGQRAVWDFLSLADRPKRASFTSYPHLTLAVHADHLEVAITIPNGAVRAVRKRLIDLGAEGLIELNAQILKRARRIVSRGGWIQAYAVQRHYLSDLMNVSLTPELEKLVQEKVKTGRYNSASEVVREALRLLEEQDQLRALRLEEVRKKIAEGLFAACEKLAEMPGIDSTRFRIAICPHWAL
jgi:putative addiction module CopG family antidote